MLEVPPVPSLDPLARPAAQPSLAPSGGAAAPRTLPRELADFLVELAIAMHKHAIYPPGHPLLAHAVDAVANRLTALLADRPAVSIGVARRQLVIEGVASDPAQPLLAELAQKLHRHHIGALKVLQGVARDEIADVLATIAVDAGLIETPIGLMLHSLEGRWEHVRLFPLVFDRLELLEDEEGAPAAEGGMRGGRAAQLWVGLARASLVRRAASSDDEALEPAAVARAIDDHEREDAYDQVIVGHLLQIAGELRAGEDAPDDAASIAGLRTRVSRLVSTLRPDTLAKLLEMGGDLRQRHHFLREATRGMSVDAVVELVKAAAVTERQTISHSLVRLLSKLAHHADAGVAAQREAADRNLRETVVRLLGDWTLADPNPDAYRAALEQISRSAPRSASAAEGAPADCEPERIVAMALESGAAGTMLWRALDRLEREERLDALFDLLDAAAPGPVAAEIRARLRRNAILERLLAADHVDLALVERLVRHERLSAVGILLDATLEIDDPRTLERLFDLLASLGPEVAPRVVRRLEAVSRAAAPRATVQRDLLALLGRFERVPADFDGRPFLRHPEAYVRREAVKLLLRDPAARDEALMAALADSDDRTAFAGLLAAQDRCPPEAIALVRVRMDRDELDPPLRPVAIRVVASARAPDTLSWLAGFVAAPLPILRRLRLRPAGPDMLAALGAIAAGWRDDAAAQPVLRLATRSRDPRVRALVR